MAKVKKIIKNMISETNLVTTNKILLTPLRNGATSSEYMTIQYFF
jgi:hypothetical protein